MKQYDSIPAALVAQLRKDEGLRTMPYTDTVGKLTIGYGRNLTDVGISIAEAEYLLRNDITRAGTDLDRNLSWPWRHMPEPAVHALWNMCFNLGWPRLSKFKKMLAALERGDYEAAGAHALKSKWAVQVGRRALVIDNLYRAAAKMAKGAS